MPCAQQLVLTPEQLKGEPVKLQFVKFQSVSLLSIFVESNQGGTDTTKVQKIGLSGTTGETMNVANIKKEPNH